MMSSTIIAYTNPEHPNETVISQAAQILQKGGLVAFPTETVYGLGGNGLDTQACKAIYQAKGRPSDNPLILHIADEKDLYRIVSQVSPTAQKIMDVFWPGPITLIFPKAPIVPQVVTGGLDTVAVRFPSHPVARALIRKAGLPIAAPSANSSGKPSPTRASHVEYDLKDKIDMIIDAGPTMVGLESTILDVSEQKPTLLRPGAITREMLEAVIGTIEVDTSVLEKPDETLRPKAPGMKYTHYSPEAEIILVKGNQEKVIAKINSLIVENSRQGLKVGVLATDQTKNDYTGEWIFSLGNRDKQEELGANLFKMLRKLDYYNMDIVFSEMFEESGEGMAIMNRLKKAAGYHIIEA